MIARKHRWFIFVIVVICLVVSAVYYFICTKNGSSSTIRAVSSIYFGSENIDIQKAEGTLLKTLVLQDIRFNNIRWLPQGNSLKIQKIEICLGFFSPEEFKVKIDNGRLNLPGFDIIFFYGSYQNNSLDFSVYSNVLDVHQVLTQFTEDSEVKNISGILRNIDIKVNGMLSEPKINGEFRIDQLSQKYFNLINCFGSLDLQLKDIKNDLKLYGDIVLMRGEMSGPKTAIVKLEESKIIFSGKPDNPSFNLKGTAKVEGIQIRIELKGTIDKPDLKLISQPALSQERLLVMLATNRTWKGTEAAIGKGELSPDIAKDFLDYFVFSGTGNKIAQKLGINAILFQYDEKVKKIGAAKNISGKASVSYSVEQLQTERQQVNTTHNVVAEYQITDNISVGAEKELKQSNNSEQVQDNGRTDDKVLLKFKKEF